MVRVRLGWVAYMHMQETLVAGALASLYPAMEWIGMAASSVVPDSPVVMVNPSRIEGPDSRLQGILPVGWI